MTKPWLSGDDIATHLSVTKDTMYTWIATRGMPAHKIGRLWKFQTSEVDDGVRRDGAATNESGRHAPQGSDFGRSPFRDRKTS